MKPLQGVLGMPGAHPAHMVVHLLGETWCAGRGSQLILTGQNKRRPACGMVMVDPSLTWERLKGYASKCEQAKQVSHRPWLH